MQQASKTSVITSSVKNPSRSSTCRAAPDSYSDSDGVLNVQKAPHPSLLLQRAGVSTFLVDVSCRLSLVTNTFYVALRFIYYQGQSKPIRRKRIFNKQSTFQGSFLWIKYNNENTFYWSFLLPGAE